MKIQLAYLVLILTLNGLGGCDVNNKKMVPASDKGPDTISAAHANSLSVIDQSPMDMSYFPDNYPLLKMEGKTSELPVMRIIYSRPHKKGRKIFGDDEKSLCRFGKEWRLGANEASEIEFFKDVVVGGNKISKGRYIIYCIPDLSKWKIILNSNLYTWGLHMDTSKDILKTDIPTVTNAPAIEDFTMVFVATAYGADLLMAWDNVKVNLPIIFYH